MILTDSGIVGNPAAASAAPVRKGAFRVAFDSKILMCAGTLRFSRLHGP